MDTMFNHFIKEVLWFVELQHGAGLDLTPQAYWYILSVYWCVLSG